MQPLLGELIRLERERQNLTIRKMAARAGVSPSLISKLERGIIKCPTRLILLRLANALQVPVDLLEATAKGEPFSVVVMNPPYAQDSKHAQVFMELEPPVIEALSLIRTLDPNQLTALNAFLKAMKHT